MRLNILSLLGMLILDATIKSAFSKAELVTLTGGADEEVDMMDDLLRSFIALNQGCGSGYFSNASASTPIASASTNKKRPFTIYFNFCGSVACLLLHFIILRKQKPSFIAITLSTSLKLIVMNYAVFVFLRYQNSC